MAGIEDLNNSKEKYEKMNREINESLKQLMNASDYMRQAKEDFDASYSSESGKKVSLSFKTIINETDRIYNYLRNTILKKSEQQLANINKKIERANKE